MMPKNKKGVLDNMAGLLISLASIAIVIVVTMLILAQAGNQAVSIDGNTANLSACTSYACNSTKTTLSAMDTIPGWLSIIVIIVIGGILIGLVKFFRR